MVKKIKKVFILFICTLLLIANISISAFKPMQVYATDAVIEYGAIEGAKLLAWLVATGLVSIGAYEIYENEDYVNEVIDSYIVNNSSGMIHPVFEYDETTGNTYLSGTEITINDYYASIKDWDLGNHWGDDVIISPPWEDTPTEVKNPYTGEWEEVGSFDVLFPWEQDLYGVDKPIVFPWDTETIGKLQDWWQTHSPEDYENAKKNGSNGGGGGSGDNGSSNNKNKWTDLLKDFNPDTVAKIGAGAVISVGTFLDKLTVGDTGNEIIDSWVNEIPDPIYNGTLFQNSDGQYIVSIKTYDTDGTFYTFDTVTSDKPYGAYLNGYFNYCYVRNGKRYTANVSYTKWKLNSDGTYSASASTLSSYIPCGGGVYASNIPVFNASDATSMNAYALTGDDSGCLNKEETQKLVWADMNTLANALPSTLSPFATLPEGKAIKATALKDYVDDMTSYKSTASPSDLANPDTQTQTATQTAQKAVEKNTVDTKTDTDEKEEEKPIFVPPSTTPIDIDGSEVTRDWRLVFPFCIPFDIIDLFTTLIAEPVAPRFEFPMQFPDYGIDYTFVIDFNDFEVLAKVFRTCETALFILSLCILTGKVIKW